MSVEQQTVMVNLSEIKRIHESNQKLMGSHLSWFNNNSEKILYPLSNTQTLIGKTEDCHIQIRGGMPGVKHFAIITHVSDAFFIEPLSRFVPVKVQGEIIKNSTPLSDGNRLQVFNQMLQFNEEM